MKTLEDFDREHGRGGEDTLEVPARIAEAYGVFPEDAGRRTRRSGAEGRSDSATLCQGLISLDTDSESFLRD